MKETLFESLCSAAVGASWFVVGVVSILHDHAGSGLRPPEVQVLLFQVNPLGVLPYSPESVGRWFVFVHVAG